MINELVNTYIFGILLTFIVFCFMSKMAKKINNPLFNPLLFSVITIIIFLKLTGITYDQYNVGGSVISSLIAPATVALAIPLYKNLHLLKKHYNPIITGIVLGNTVNCVLLAYICKLFNYENSITASFMTKSVTTAIAIGVSESMGAFPSITVILVVITGITGGVFGFSIFKLLNITDDVSIGIGLGSASHAMGTSKAAEYSEAAGAMAGLSICLTGIYVMIIAPIVFNLIVV